MSLHKTTSYRRSLLIILAFSVLNCEIRGQVYEVKSMFYNTLLGGLSAAIGSVINKTKETKPHKAFLRGFAGGCAGGALMYTGKKMNMLVASQKNLGYAWLSRVVFSAGNSIVENAASNLPLWSRWHLDIGFLRMEFKTKNREFTPRLMVSSFAAFVFTTLHGNFDARTSLRSGTVTFRTGSIAYARHLVGSTTGNNFVLVDTLYQHPLFYEIYAHEMVHTFQFQELSGCNYYIMPLENKWRSKYPPYAKVSRYIYGDLNYELMLLNYFVIQGGTTRSLYCKNYLENEAEVLTTGRVSCPDEP